MDKYPQLNSKLASASSTVNNQLAKLRILDKKFILTDEKLSCKILVNIKNGNNIKADILAKELVNIRKIKNITGNLILKFEVILIRFSTMSDFAQVLDTINPVVDTIKSLKNDIGNTIPEAKNIISEMSSITNEVLVNTDLRMDVPQVQIPADSEALKILDEIQIFMEEETKSRLPEIPHIIQNKKTSLSESNVGEKSHAVLVEG